MSEGKTFKSIRDDSNNFLGIKLELKGFDFSKYHYQKKKSITWIPNRDRLDIRLLDQELEGELEDFFNHLSNKIDLNWDNEKIFLELRKAFRKRLKLHSNARSLSRSEVMGLYGEMLFLKELLLNNNHDNSLKAWRRPQRSAHDFDFKDHGYEIKSLGLNSTEVKIANLNQLDILDHQKLFLVCYFIEIHTSKSVNSTKALYNEICQILKTPLAIDEFTEKINYELDDFEYEIIPQKKITCDVDDSFPKLLSSDINDNIKDVSYSIDISYIKANGKKSKVVK